MPELDRPVILSATIAGCEIGFAAGGPAWRQAAEAAAACLEGPALDPGGPSSDGRAGVITCGAGSGAPPGGPPDVIEGEVRAWTRIPAPYLELGEVTVVLSAAAAAIDGEVDGDPERASALIDRAMPTVLGWLLSPLDRWVVHGTAVLPASATTAVLAVGPAGAGKSTTAASTLAAGGRVLADDLVAVRWVDGEPQVCGIRRPLAVPADIGATGGDVGPIAGDPRHRRRIPADHLEPGWWPLAAVAVLAHGDLPDTVAYPIAGMEALRTLWSAYFAAAIPAELRRWFPLAAQLSRLPAWRLALGADPTARLSSTAVALEGITATLSPPPRR